MSGAVIAGIVVLLIVVAGALFYFGIIPGTPPYFKKVVEDYYKSRTCEQNRVALTPVGSFAPAENTPAAIKASAIAGESYEELSDEVKTEVDNAHIKAITACLEARTEAEVKIDRDLLVNSMADSLVGEGQGVAAWVLDNRFYGVDGPKDAELIYETGWKDTMTAAEEAEYQTKQLAVEVSVMEAINTKMNAKLATLDSSYTAGDAGELCLDPDPAAVPEWDLSIQRCVDAEGGGHPIGFNYTPLLIDPVVGFAGGATRAGCYRPNVAHEDGELSCDWKTDDLTPSDLFYAKSA